jgi:hypothetical protein
MQSLLLRHQLELDNVVTNFRNELSLLDEEYELLQTRVDQQYQIDIAENKAKVQTAALSIAGRLTRSVSPRQQMRAHQQAIANKEALATPIAVRTRLCPNSV